ncbi:hypothetical protein [Nocardia camponoti]|nr:hypothetical protein [Nocardia camponoti]
MHTVGFGPTAFPETVGTGLPTDALGARLLGHAGAPGAVPHTSQ